MRRHSEKRDRHGPRRPVRDQDRAVADSVCQVTGRRPAFFDPGQFYRCKLLDAKYVPAILAAYAGPQENIGQ